MTPKTHTDLSQIMYIFNPDLTALAPDLTALKRVADCIPKVLKTALAALLISTSQVSHASFENLWVAAGYHGSNTQGAIAISEDKGAHWKRVWESSNWDKKSNFGAIYDIAYFKKKSLWVAVGKGGILISESDASNWSNDIATPPGVKIANLKAVTCGQDMCVAVGASTSIVYSTDGIYWRDILFSNIPDYGPDSSANDLLSKQVFQEAERLRRQTIDKAITSGMRLNEAMALARTAAARQLNQKLAAKGSKNSQKRRVAEQRAVAAWEQKLNLKETGGNTYSMPGAYFHMHYSDVIYKQGSFWVTGPRSLEFKNNDGRLALIRDKRHSKNPTLSGNSLITDFNDINSPLYLVGERIGLLKSDQKRWSKVKNFPKKNTAPLFGVLGNGHALFTTQYGKLIAFSAEAGSKTINLQQNNLPRINPHFNRLSFIEGIFLLTNDKQLLISEDGSSWQTVLPEIDEGESDDEFSFLQVFSEKTL